MVEWLPDGYTIEKIEQLAFAVETGAAREFDAALLLRFFCDAVEVGAISTSSRAARVLLVHMHRAVDTMLTGYSYYVSEMLDEETGKARLHATREVMTAERAFGLRFDRFDRVPLEDQRTWLAMEVLRHFLDGMRKEDAVRQVAAQGIEDPTSRQPLRRGEKTIESAWNEQKVIALQVFFMRGHIRRPLTDAQKKILRRLYGRRMNDPSVASILDLLGVEGAGHRPA